MRKTDRSLNQKNLTCESGKVPPLKECSRMSALDDERVKQRVVSIESPDGQLYSLIVTQEELEARLPSLYEIADLHIRGKHPMYEVGNFVFTDTFWCCPGHHTSGGKLDWIAQEHLHIIQEGENFTDETFQLTFNYVVEHCGVRLIDTYLECFQNEFLGLPYEYDEEKRYRLD